MIRQARSYLLGAVSSTAVIAAAVVAFALIVSAQALRDWPIAGLGLDRGDEVSTAVGSNGSTAGESGGTGSAATGAAGTTAGGGSGAGAGPASPRSGRPLRLPVHARTWRHCDGIGSGRAGGQAT